MANFTNKRISQTYQRVVQVDGGTLQDGLGNTLSGSMSDLTVNGTLAITGHSNVSSSLSRLDNFSSSLNATYATDAELASVSSSLASETAQLLDFSASLNNDFATDAELATAVSALNAATGSYVSHSANIVDLPGKKVQYSNVYTNIGDLPSATDYHGMFAHVHNEGAAYYAHGGNWIELANSSSFASVIAGLDASGFATDAELAAAVSGLNSSTGSYALKTEVSGSFNVASSSLASRIASQESFSSSLDATFATDAQVSTAVSALNAATSSYALDAEVEHLNTVTGSYAITGSNTFTGTQTISGGNSLYFNSSGNPGTGGGVNVYLSTTGSNQVYGGLQIINTDNFNAGIEINSYTGLDGTDPVFRLRGGGNNQFSRNTILNAFADGSITVEKEFTFQDGLIVSSSKVLGLQPSPALPTGSAVTTGSLAVSGSGSDLAVYLYAGTGSFGPGYSKITGTSAFLTSASAAAAGFGSGGGGGVSSYTDLTNVPGGILSSSAQIDALGYVTSSEASDFSGLNAFTGSIQGEVDAIKVTTGSLQTEVNNLTAATSSYVSSSTVDFIQIMTSASYAAITPVSGTLYIIQG